MLVPEAWEGQPEIPRREARILRVRTAPLVQPWDGPAAMAFADGVYLEATLRPQASASDAMKYVVTASSFVVAASELQRRRLSSPKTSSRRAACSPAACCFRRSGARSRGGGRGDRSASSRRASRTRSEAKAARSTIFRALPEAPERRLLSRRPSARSREKPRHRAAFGYTREGVRVLLAPMAANAEEPTGSMRGRRAAGRCSGHRPREPVPDISSGLIRAGHPIPRSARSARSS